MSSIGLTEIMVLVAACGCLLLVAGAAAAAFFLVLRQQRQAGPAAPTPVADTFPATVQDLRDSAAFRPPPPALLEVIDAVELLDRGKHIDLHGAGVVIGRRPDLADFLLNSPTVSGHHATISYDHNAGLYVLHDQRSRNGTRVDGQWLKPGASVALKDGSLIQFGRSVRLRFVLTPPRDSAEEMPRQRSAPSFGAAPPPAAPAPQPARSAPPAAVPAAPAAPAKPEESAKLYSEHRPEPLTDALPKEAGSDVTPPRTEGEALPAVEEGESEWDEHTVPEEPVTMLPGHALPGALRDASAVRFAAYYPREVLHNEWQPLIAYMYRGMLEARIAEDARQQLGDRLSTMRRVEQQSGRPIAPGALITATPYLPGFDFNPPRQQLGFFEDWHRLDFKLRATPAAPLHQAANGHLTFTVEGVIVAQIPLAIFVEDEPSLAAAEIQTAAQQLYQAIFCSYSHEDTPIIERVERAYLALGLDYLRDVRTLRSGQDWDDQLLQMIAGADVFQLFWSQAAARSPYVEREWRHALAYLEQRPAFIRPVYWEQPMPPVPQELGAIHFSHQPDLIRI